MEPSCVRQTLIPGTSQLYGDYLYNFERVQQFYSEHFSNFDCLVESARSLSFPESRRAAIVSALRSLNPASPALDKLSKPGTVAIVTGQQVGLLSGPIYTIFKALTAVKLAERLEGEGVAAVPVFWLASEDHDVAEVDHAWVYDHHASPTRISVKATSIQNIPVGNAAVEDMPLGTLQHALGELPFAAETLTLVRKHYGTPTTFGRSFHGFVKEVLKDFDLIFLDPLQPEIRALAGPFLGEVAARVPELTGAIRQRNAQLEAAGYHAQVHVDQSASLLFLLEEGRRTALKFRDGQFSAKDRTFSGRELAAIGHQISPNALLRPVMQDYLLPTASYVGGPAEIAYLAQSQVLYQRLLPRMPVIYPRNSFTLLDARATKLLDRYHLHVEDLFDSRERVKSVIAGRMVPTNLHDQMAGTRAVISSALGDLREKLLHFDPTLAAATEKSLAKISYQVDKISFKTARETMRRDQHAAGDADYLINLLYPQRHLQERFYSVVPFLAEYGLDLPRRLYEHVQLSCPDHMLRDL